ncbi:MAG TPA: hypothetical protein VMT46_06025 [Anaerolineaceae bacterium]|nr:hypothetical protein [Anaerolineaceae bacterium]
MDHIRIIKRAFQITRFYPALWLFGAILALTGASTGGSSGGNGSSSSSGGGGNANPPSFPHFNISPEVGSAILAAVIGLICFVIILAVIFTILRYVSMTALVRMVDEYETSNEKVTVGQGFRLGWTRASLNNWLLDLIIGIVGFTIAILLLAVACAPLLLWLTKNNTLGIIGTVMTVGAVLLLIMVFIIVGIAVSIILEVAHRAIILEGLGIFEGLGRGWELCRRRPGDAIIMGLLLFGIGLVYGILMIPVGILVFLIALLSGGLPAVLTWAVVRLFAQGATPIVIGAIVGLPIFLLVLAVPYAFLKGLLETFKSSSWTLTFRELVALNTLGPAPAAPSTPAAEPPSSDEPAQ